VTAAAGGRPAAATGWLRPEWRLAELVLLALGATLGVVAAAQVPLQAHGALALADVAPALILSSLFLALHFSLVLRGRGTDQIILPIVQVLMLVGLAVMQRLAVGLDAPGLDTRHWRWLVLGLGMLALVLHAPWDIQVLRRYRYTWALGGLGLVAATFLFGHATRADGPRLWLGVGGQSFQPSELLKLVVIIYLAGYLSEKQDLLAGAIMRLGPVTVAPLAYLAPVAIMLGLSLGLLAVQRDLGAALLVFVIALGLVYAASGRLGLVGAGLALFVAGAWLLNDHVAVVSTRTAIWLNPWVDAQGHGYQLVQALLAIGAGGVLGTGLGYGLPTAIPAVHTDFVYAAVGEELGLAGASAVLALYLVLILRGFRIAVRATDPFERLLATGLAFAIAVQVFIIVGGVLKVIPLTGITLPFLSYGGTSLVTSAIAIGLLLRVSGTRR
jgi:cell division protein FtsW (lipid II flippase)